jgi:hypothetical protein
VKLDQVKENIINQRVSTSLETLNCLYYFPQFNCSINLGTVIAKFYVLTWVAMTYWLSGIARNFSKCMWINHKMPQGIMLSVVTSKHIVGFLYSAKVNTFIYLFVLLCLSFIYPLRMFTLCHFYRIYFPSILFTALL